VFFLENIQTMTFNLDIVKIAKHASYFKLYLHNNDHTKRMTIPTEADIVCPAVTFFRLLLNFKHYSETTTYSTTTSTNFSAN
jgi:hypothetical protein